MIYKLLYKLFQNRQKSLPVMIRAKKIDNAKITGNTVVNGGVLDADELTNSDINKNKVIWVPPKELHWFWKYSIDLFFWLLLAFLTWKFGWN